MTSGRSDCVGKVLPKDEMWSSVESVVTPMVENEQNMKWKEQVTI